MSNIIVFLIQEDMMFKLIGLLIVLTSCSVTTETEFINNIIGHYEGYAVPGYIMEIDNTGTILQENIPIYRLHQVLETNKAVYFVVGTPQKYAPVYYTMDIIYIGENSEEAGTVDFTTVTAVAIKVY